MTPPERQPIRPPGTYACAACGESYDQSFTSRGALPLCSPGCRTVSHNRLHGRRRCVRHCEACGDPFATLRYNKTRFCSVSCGHAFNRRERPCEYAAWCSRGAATRATRKAARPATRRACECCGGAFGSKGVGPSVPRFCSPACRSRAYRADPVSWVTRACATCGGPFLALKNQPTRVCSLSCRRGKVPP